MTTAQPGQEQRMGTISAKEMRDRLLAGLERPTADLGEDGELDRRLRARTTNDGLGDPDDDLINPDGPEAADRLILYREARDQVEQIISAWAFSHNIDGAARNDLFDLLRREGLSRSGG